MPEIKNPILTLYAFHLAEEGYQKPAKNANQIWANLQIVAKKLNLTVLDNHLEHLNPKQPLKEWDNLLETPLLKLYPTPNHPNQPIKIKASFRAEKAQDIFIGELTLSAANKTKPVATGFLRYFNPDNCLFQPTIKANFGQIILLYVEPINFDNYRQLTDNCVENLTNKFQTETISFIKEGKILGSPIFEYQNNSPNPLETCHILVWLKDSPDTLNLVTKEFDLYLKNIFLYQRKIEYAYYHGRQEYIQGQSQAKRLEEKKSECETINQETEQKIRLQKYRELLKYCLQQSFTYRQHLSYLQEFQTSLAINTINFTQSLQDVKSLTLKDDNLNLWTNFLKLVKNTYQKQLEADINYLNINLNLFQEMIDTIQANLNIEQIEIDRQNLQQDAINSKELNINLAAVGAWIGVAGVAATSYPLYIEKPWFMPWNKDARFFPPHPFVSSFLGSLLVGLAFAGGCLITLKRKKKKQQKMKAQETTKNE